MFHDLNVPWQKEAKELQRTVAFLDECMFYRPLLWFQILGLLSYLMTCILTQSSRIRRDCSYPHVHRAPAYRSRKCHVFLRIHYQIYQIQNLTTSDPNTHPIPQTTTPAHPPPLQHLPHRLRLQLPHPRPAKELRPHRRAPMRRKDASISMLLPGHRHHLHRPNPKVSNALQVPHARCCHCTGHQD
jgi:hypothetical protein